jgi:glucoamylase
LITSAAAEFLYDAVAQWKSNKALTIDSTSLPFFQAIYPSAKAEKYIPSNGFNTNSGEFTKITDAVTTYADSFVSIVEKYLPSNGSISEQFNRNTSLPLSAYDLTWSFAAFVTMSQRRAGQYPASWGAKSSVQSAQCAGTSTPGAYAPAIAAGAPNLTTTCQVEVTFNVNATTYYGENVYVVGNTSDLGAWNINNALPLGAGGYPIWSASSYLNAGETVSYVFVREEDCSQPNIYETVNRTLTVPACGGATVTVNYTWTGPLGVSGDC